MLFILYDNAFSELSRHIQTFTGEVGGGNFTYYKLTRSGNIRIKLVSVSGDADLYCSSQILHPDFDKYDFKSATYGDDIVDITATCIRPVGISIYGHPYSFKSVYELSIYIDDKDTSNNMFDAFNKPSDDDESIESIIYNIVINILRVLLDVLL